MSSPTFIPSLSTFDVDQAVQLIQQAYAPPSTTTTPEHLKRLQNDLFQIQKRPEAWGLVIPLLNHQDQNVQFFGAHTAQVKIARDWDAFPSEHIEGLRDLMIQLTAHSVAIGRSKFILRKLFVALTSLALKLAPGHPSRWPDWILSCASTFSSQGASTEHVHDFLAIVAEEVSNADLLGPSKLQMRQSMTNATTMVVQAITGCISQPLGAIPSSHYLSALRCLQTWMSFLRTDDLIPLIPLLISLLDPSFPDDSIFIAGSDALQEIASKSALSDGSGSKTLTEPLLIWFDVIGNRIMESTLATNEVSPISHSLCKLLVALGDHSTSYIAVNISSPTPVSLNAASQTSTKGHLTQNFLRLLLAYTGLPGYYGVDEEESEITLGFWYLFQEALWSTNYYFENGDEGRSSVSPDTRDRSEAQEVLMAKAVYSELVKVLRRKVAFPPAGSGWLRDQVDKFQVYRRDVGDTLINAYYVLRDDMLGYYVNDIAERLATRRESDGWQEIEATLHCIMSIQEALNLEQAPHLQRLFSPEVFGRLPSTGRTRVRRTALGVIGVYSSWFATQSHPPPSSTSSEPNLLLTVLTYVVSALADPSLSLSAAVALRNLCEANRKNLAAHIGAFGELHAGLDRIPDSEKSKVLQSIASVIQAMPPMDEIPAIEAIVNPNVQKIFDALGNASTLPDDARASTILHLETLSGIAKGLTRTLEGLSVLEESKLDVQGEAEKIRLARDDPRATKLREAIFTAIRGVVELWSIDAGVSNALSDLFKSITSLPSDTTLISLPASPLLELVCLAAQRQLTAAWLSLAAILFAQLNPPVFPLNAKSGPTQEAKMYVERLLPILLQCGLGTLSMDGAMDANPDIVQEFFSCMDRVAQDFTKAFYTLPPGLFDALVQSAIKALSVQERYSLVAACNFLTTLVNRSSLTEALIVHRTSLLATHGRSLMRAVLAGFAGVAPRSVLPNLIEMLGTLLTRASDTAGTGGGATQWMNDILMSDDFVTSKAGPDAKAKFIKAVAGSRSLKKTREAAQQFTLVARGLEGSNFGYSTLTM